jgi:O-antigen ligase
VAGAAALGRGPAWSARPLSSERVVAWTALGAGVAIATTGLIASSQVLVGIGGALIAILGAFLAPQLTLAVFLVAGGLKAAPWLAGVPGDLTVLTAGGVIVAMIVRAVKSDGIPPFPLASLLAVAITVLIVLSVLWSPEPELGLDKALRFQTFTMLAFFAPLVLVRSRSDLFRLMIFLVAVSLVVALTAVPGRDPNQPLTVAGGESEIELALYASSGVVAIAGYLMLIGRSRLRFLWLIPAGVLALTVIDAGSRGVLVGSAVTLLVIAIRAVVRARSKIVPVAVVAIAVVAAISVISNLSGPAAAKYQGLLSGNEPATFGKRNFLIQDGIDVALAYPMGRGAAGYQHETLFPYPHNAFVEVAAEQGVIGLALLLALVFAAFRSSLRAREGPRSPESILAGGLLLVLLFDAMVSQGFTQFRELWLAMGLCLAVPYIGAHPRDRTGAPVS